MREPVSSPADPYSLLPEPVARLARQDYLSNRRTGTIVGLVMMAIGLGLAGWIFAYTVQHHRPLNPRGEELLPMLGGLILAGLGVWWLRGARRPDVILAALTAPGVEVVWIYQLERRGRSGTSVTLKLALSDGKIVPLGVGRTGAPARVPALLEHGHALLDEIAAHYPRAVQGYSADRLAAFRRDPRSVR